MLPKRKNGMWCLAALAFLLAPVISGVVQILRGIF
jgi:hypothetical protein